MPWQFYLAAIPAVILVGLSKGGFSGLSLLSIPLLALVTSPIRAAAIMLPILIVQDVVSVWAYRRSFNGRIVAIMIPGGILGIALAAITAAYVTDAIVVLGVGVIASGFVLYTWLRPSGSRETPRTGSVSSGVFWGACSGFTSFIANAGGPPFQVHVLPQRLSPPVYAGTMTMVFAAINWMKGRRLLCDRAGLVREFPDFRDAVPAGDRCHYGRHLAGAARFGPAVLPDHLCVHVSRRPEADLRWHPQSDRKLICAGVAANLFP